METAQVPAGLDQARVAWKRQRRQTLATLCAVLVVGLGLPALVQPLNLFKVSGFPLGFFIAAAAAPILVAAVLLLHARRANRLDRLPARAPRGRV